MGAGASSGISAATKAASVDDINTLVQGLSAEQRAKLTSALNYTEAPAKSEPPADEKKPAAEEKKS